MRAVVYRPTSAGSPLVVDRPAPALTEGTVRIRVEAAAVNPADIHAAAGHLDDLLGRFEGDHVLGWDVAGTVLESAPGPGALAPGTRVVAMAQQFPAGPGTHAEEVVLPAAHVAVADGLDAVAASTLPLNGITADQALGLLDLPRGASLLVTGGAGAVGGYAVELARQAGLRVLAVARAGDVDWLHERGVGDVLTPGQDDVVAAVRDLVPDGVDGALDAAPLGPATIGAVRDGGAYVSVLGPTAPAPERGIRVQLQSVTADGPRLARLVELARRGLLTTRVSATRPLAEAVDAYQVAAGGGSRGRVVLVP